jgi:hypothetical protein
MIRKENMGSSLADKVIKVRKFKLVLNYYLDGKIKKENYSDQFH